MERSANKESCRAQVPEAATIERNRRVAAGGGLPVYALVVKYENCTPALPINTCRTTKNKLEG